MKTILRSALGVFAVILILVVLLIVWPSKSAPLPDVARDRIITNARVVDVVEGTVSRPLSVRIRNGVIVEIAPDIAAANLPGLDARGGYLVPAFWDMHVHTFQSSPQVHFPLWIANGVTNVRDMMDCPEERDSLIACAADKRGWNAEIAEGRLAAPRFVEVASYYLESPDIDPAEAARRVQAYQARGIDAVKVYNRLQPAAYQAAAREAQVRGMRLVGHLPRAISLEEAIEAGQASFEHAHLLPQQCSARTKDWRVGKLDSLSPTARLEALSSSFDPARCDDVIAALAAAGSWHVPTHVTREEDARASDPVFLLDPRLVYLDPLSRFAWDDDLSSTISAYPGKRGERALKSYFGHGLQLTGKAYAGGVGILVGTDTVIGGFRYHDELAHLVAAGLTPAEVLRAATWDAARYSGEADTAGTVAVGKRADLVLLSENPLEDIAHTRTVVAVFQEGRLYDRKKLDELLAFARKEAAAPHNMAKLIWGFLRSSVSGDL